MVHLPEETISTIIGYLRINAEENEDHNTLRLNTLAAAGRVNKAFARIVQPVLYRTFDDANLDLLLTKFVAALVRNPSLIPLVREVRLGNGDENEDDTIGQLLMRRILPQIYSLAESLPISHALKKNILRHLRKSPRSGLEALLLVMCPNVGLIEIDDYICYGEGLLATIMNAEQTENKPHAYLSQLEEVIVHTGREESEDVTYEIDKLSWLSRHPSVHTFRGYGMMFTDGSTMKQPPCTNLKYLFLEDVDIDVENSSFKNLLIKFPALEKLSIAYGHSDYRHYGNYYAKTGIALSRNGLQLCALSLDTREATWDLEGNSDDVDSMEPIGDLSALDKLRCLSLPEEALLGTTKDVVANLRNTLPPNLKKLEITGCGESSISVDQLDKQLMQTIRTDCFSDLESISIEREKKFSHDLSRWGWVWTVDEKTVKCYRQTWQRLQRHIYGR